MLKTSFDVPKFGMESFEEAGFAILPDVIAQAHACQLRAVLLHVQQRAGQVSGGVRNLMNVSPEVRNLATSHVLCRLVEPILGDSFFPVRAILFDKTPDANWKVPWHQDVTIAVKQRVDVAGYGPWSIKAGVQHVQPPASILEQMVSIRLHLDDCPADSGALRVIPASHRCGKLTQADVRKQTELAPAVTCEIATGGVLAMRPLLLHASSESSSKSDHRRVIHIDYAAARLPVTLEWAEAAQ